MDMKRFAEIVDAYGGDLARWPESEREAARAFMQDSAEARRMATEGRALDAMLGHAENAAVPADLEGRILASRRPPASFAEKLRALWPGSTWRPAFALAMSVVLGLGVGLTVPVFSLPDDEDDGIEVATLWLGDNDVLDLSTETENDN